MMRVFTPVATIYVVVVSMLCTAATAQFQWTQITPATSVAPSPRQDPGIGMDIAGNRLFLFGGKNTDGILDDTWVFDFATSIWTPIVTANKPIARFSMISGYHSSGFVITYGEAESKTFPEDLWIFDGTDWVEVAPSTEDKPDGRYGAAGGIYEAGSPAIYISHGFKSGQRFSDAWKFEFATKTWTQVNEGSSEYNPFEPSARCIVGSAMASEGAFVMFGGCASGGKTGGLCPNPEAWYYKGDGSWTDLPNKPSPRVYPGLARIPSGEIIVYGGQETGAQMLQVSKSPANQIYLIDPTTEMWQKYDIDGVVPGKRSRIAMASTSTGAVMFGGQLLTDGGGDSNELWQLTGTPVAGQSGGSTVRFLSWPILHGIFMVLGWGILLQAGAFIARYFRHRDPWWFKMHKNLQIAGVVCALLGFIFALLSVQGNHFMFAHGGIGLLLTLIAVEQPINGILRPHKEKGQPVTRNRQLWQYLHIWGGRLGLLFAMINIALGLLMIGSPSAVWILWFVVFALLAVAYVVMEVFKRQEDGGASKRRGIAV